MARSTRHQLKQMPLRPVPPVLAVLILAVSVAEPLANVPQIATIYGHHAAGGVSITSWCLYALFALTWLTYGLYTRQRPMIVGGSLFFLTDTLVIIGAISYGGTW